MGWNTHKTFLLVFYLILCYGFIAIPDGTLYQQYLYPARQAYNLLFSLLSHLVVLGNGIPVACFSLSSPVLVLSLTNSIGRVVSKLHYLFFKVLERVLNSIVEKLIICKNFLFPTFVLFTRFCMKSIVSLILNNGVIIFRITMVMITSSFCYFVSKSVKPNIIPYKEIFLMSFCFFLILVFLI